MKLFLKVLYLFSETILNVSNTVGRIKSKSEENVSQSPVQTIPTKKQQQLHQAESKRSQIWYKKLL